MTTPPNNLGLNTDLGGATQNLDQTVNQTLDNVGGELGNPSLGNQVGQGLNQTTNDLLGQRRVTEQLLNP